MFYHYYLQLLRDMWNNDEKYDLVGLILFKHLPIRLSSFNFWIKIQLSLNKPWLLTLKNIIPFYSHKREMKIVIQVLDFHKWQQKGMVVHVGDSFFVFGLGLTSKAMSAHLNTWVNN